MVLIVCFPTREVSGEELEDDRDLKATITHREKQGTRADSYINYRIVTEVCTREHPPSFISTLSTMLCTCACHTT